MPGELRPLRGWSYSAWSSLMSCPFRFEQSFLRGWKAPKSWPLERGIQQHKIAEQYLKGAVSVLPKTFAFFRDHYRELRGMKPVIEEFWGVDEKFQPYEPNIKKGERSWCVMKMDAAVPPTKRNPVLFIQDLKMGRIYDSHIKQAGLYSVFGLTRFPRFDEAHVEFWYADQGEVRSYTYTRSRLKELMKLWIERGREVMAPRKKYRATPSVDACKYCFLRTSEGGPCNRWREVL